MSHRYQFLQNLPCKIRETLSHITYIKHLALGHSSESNRE